MHKSAVACAFLACVLSMAAARGAGARDLKVATWDLGWLTLRAAGDPALPERLVPRTPEDLARLARYAEILDADVVALQGVDGPEAAAKVFGPEQYVIHMTGDTGLLRSGFAVRRALEFTARPDFAQLDPYPWARYRLRSGADISLQSGLRLLSVHLKSGCRQEPLDADKPACRTLGLQVAALRGWVAEREAAHEAFLVLGDFARVMDGDPGFLSAIAGEAKLLRATERRATPCWGRGNFVDHILAGGAAREWDVADSLRVMAFRETDPSWRTRLTEHCPVSWRLRLPE